MSVTTQLDSQHPWPGLRAFTERDREFFFGREHEVAELLELVEQSPAAVLYGQSGLGKTSLIQAGLFPALKQRDYLALRVRFEHGEDAAPLAEQIKTALSEELDRAGVHGPRPGAGETLWEYFHRRDLDLWGSGNRLLTPVIVVDQFEEVFTLGQRSEKAAARVAQFAADLESVLEHRAPAAVREYLDKNPDEALRYDFRRQSSKFLISLREDFLGYLDSWARRIPSLLGITSRFRLQAMTAAQALEVVKRGGRDLVDDAVARDIVDFVADTRHRVAPALLSVVLEELNHRRVNQGQARITAEFLSGERGKIIQDFYQRSFEGLDPQARNWVEDRLLTGGGHRQPAAMDDAVAAGIPESECNLLVDRRILNRAEREGVVWLELTHDLLTDPASKSRAEREQRRQTEEAARRQEQIRRELERSRRLAAVFGVLLVGAVTACLFVIRYSRLAKENGAKSERIFRSAADIANHLSLDAVANSWVPVATVEETIQDAESSYQKLNGPTANASDLATYVGIPRARFLARAADALYEGGHFTDGLHWSSQAMAVLTQLGPAASSGEEAQLARAEILYEEGRGSLELNKIDDATADFTEALRIVESASGWKGREDTSRVYVLAQMGLGDRYSNACTLAEAVQHFQAAYDQAQGFAAREATNKSATAAERSDAMALEIRAALALGKSQWDPVQEQKWLGVAESDLESAEKHEVSNPRWRALAADLAYDQADVAYTLGQIEGARTKVVEATTEYQELEKRDPQNWEWQLSLARSQHLLGQLSIDLHEWDLAQTLLNEANQSATQLLSEDNQSSWVDANMQRVSDLEVLSTLPLYQMIEVFDSSRAAQAEMLSEAKMPEDRRELDASFAPLSQAESILQTMQSATPKDSGCSVELAEIYNFRGQVQDLQAVFSQPNDKARLEKEALANSSQGLELLQAIEQRSPQSNPTPGFLKDEGQVFSAIASVEGDLNQPAKQIASEKASIAAYAKLVATAPTASNYEHLSSEMKTLGGLYDAEKSYSAATAQYEQAMSAIDKAIVLLKAEPGQTGPGAQQYTSDQANLYGALTDIDSERGDVHGEMSEISQELEAIWKALPADFTNESYLDDLRNCKNELDSIQDNLQSSSPPNGYRTLNAAEKAALLKQVTSLMAKTDPQSLLASQGGTWPYPPLFEGAWRTVASSDYEGEGIMHELAATRPDVTAAHVLAIRSLDLGFYGDSHLYEISAEGLHGTLIYLRRGGEWAQLTGTADAVEKMNKQSPPQLDTVARATAYVRFYLGTVQNPDLGQNSEQGPELCRPAREPWESPTPAPPIGLYSLVDQRSDVPWLDTATAQQREGIAAKIEPLKVDESPDHEWQARGTLECGGDLYHVSLRLSRSGVLDASQAEKVDTQLPVQFRFFSAGGVRTVGTKEDLLLDALKRNPKDQAALGSLIDLYGATKQSGKEEQVLLELMQRSPGNQEALHDLVALYEQTQQPGKAESLLVATLQRDPGNAAAVQMLVDFYDDNGQDAKKEALLVSVLQRDPQNEYAISNLMFAYSEAGQYSKEAALLLEVLKQNPKNKQALMALPEVYYQEKSWNDAVRAEDHWIAYVKDPKADAQTRTGRNADLLDGYRNLAWYQLFARDFAGAVASADEGMQGAAGNLELAAEKAEALMFLNRTQEADAIFLGNRGKKVAWGETWEELVLHDFSLLEKGGLSSPEMTRLRTVLQAKPAAPTSGAAEPKSQPN